MELIKYTIKEISKALIKTWVWILLPLTIFLFSITYNSYKEAGENLTPYSVSVRGYYRRDGTYIHPYHRRPSGSVRHDRPYENKRSCLYIAMIGECLIGVTSSLSFANKTFYIIKYREINYKKKL